MKGPIETTSGLLLARPGTPSECKTHAGYESCKVLAIDGRVLFANYIVTIDAAFPSSNDAKVVFATETTGGNACCWRSYLIDFTRPKPIVVKAAPPLNPEINETKIDGFSSGVTYQNYGAGTGPLGEPLWNVYRYVYGSGKVEMLRSLPKYSYTAMQSKKYPTEVLDDPVRRAPLLNVMTANDFRELHAHIQVQSPLEHVSPTIFVGEGCASHSCGSSAGMFVIDTAKNAAWAVYFEKGSGKFFGSISVDDVIPRRALDNWIRRNDMTWRQLAVTPRGTTIVSAGTTAMIPLVSEAGVWKVPVTLNGIIPLMFIVDSGAADVSVPADVLSTLIRTGTVTESDFTGIALYRLADGSVVPSRTFRIKTLRVGNRVIENVTASATGVEGSLLLGQSFLQRFHRWSINNSRRVLELQ